MGIYHFPLLGEVLFDANDRVWLPSISSGALRRKILANPTSQLAFRRPGAKLLWTFWLQSAGTFFQPWKWNKWGNPRHGLQVPHFQDKITDWLFGLAPHCLPGWGNVPGVKLPKWIPQLPTFLHLYFKICHIPIWFKVQNLPKSVQWHLPFHPVANPEVAVLMKHCPALAFLNAFWSLSQFSAQEPSSPCVQLCNTPLWS